MFCFQIFIHLFNEIWSQPLPAVLLQCSSHFPQHSLFPTSCLIFLRVSVYSNPVGWISAVHMLWNTYQLPPPPPKHNQFSLPQQISLSIAPSHWVCVGFLQGGTAAESLWVWQSYHVQRTALPSASHLHCYCCLLRNSFEVLLLLWMFSCKNLIRKQFFFSWLPIIFPLQSDEKISPMCLFPLLSPFGGYCFYFFASFCVLRI